MEVITLKDTLKEMHSGSLFSIIYVTYDKSRKTGGEIKQYDGCKLSQKNTDATEVPIFTSGSKKPSHFGNRTRNIILPSGDIRKLNVWLIIGFNGKNVTLY